MPCKLRMRTAQVYISLILVDRRSTLFHSSLLTPRFKAATEFFQIRPRRISANHVIKTHLPALNLILNPDSNSIVTLTCFWNLQIKSDLIRQREVEFLVPAAGPNASEVFHLLRPAAPTSTKPLPSAQPEAAAEVSTTEQALQEQVPVEQPAEQLPPAKPRRKLTSSLSFWSTAESLTAAAETAFGQTMAVGGEQRRQASGQVVSRRKEASAAAEALMGLSCVISANGEVMAVIYGEELHAAHSSLERESSIG
jgi:hypothetical protein